CSSAGLIRVASLERVEELTDLTLDEKATKLDVRYTAEGTLWKMGDMFQLSIELYDTIDKKVVWSDRWQEKWDNLPSIKGNLSDGVLKTLDIKPIIERKVDTIKTEAYEYYLRGEYKYDTLQSKEDMEIARGLFQKAIELDNNLLIAKHKLANTYLIVSDYDKAMGIYLDNLKQAEKLRDNIYIGLSYLSIGTIYQETANYEKAFGYYNRALNLYEKLNDEVRISEARGAVAHYYRRTGDYDKAIEIFIDNLQLSEKLGDKKRERGLLILIGLIYIEKGDYEKALNFHSRKLETYEHIGFEGGMSLLNGMIFYYKGNYKKASEYFGKALNEYNTLGIKEYLLETTAYLFLTYKYFNKEFDIDKIHRLIRDADKIEFIENYHLYQLIEDTSYLETAYNQVQEKADNLEPDVAAKFLS
ncbi:uncharacterized protein METZ01_LOCUS278722, partial [marine metagenome]